MGKRHRLRLTVTNRTGRRLPDRAVLAAPLERALEQANMRQVALSLVVVNDPEMRRINRRFRRAPGTTDVLSFSSGERDPEHGGVLLGEVIICRDRAVVEARRRRVPTREELALYALHGLLHLLGYRDDTSGRRRRMERRQERILSQLKGR